ncbi:MAG TPA: OsmC family protein [Candidatus Dormibacteraeota bacterium]|nr:OsmC family protein [Candidatus Dormibacteraeota bacterium]
MAQPTLVNRVRSYSTGTPGRCLNQARTHHFVIDEPPYRGGSGEEITPAEAFLAGISACGVLLIEGYAREDGVPLDRVEVEIEATRNVGDPSTFAGVRMRFRLAGADPDRARTLVRRYQEH